MMDGKPVRNMKFYFKNKFEKLVHLVGFIIIYHDAARSSECQSPHTIKVILKTWLITQTTKYLML
jgi:hypothetical protein